MTNVEWKLTYRLKPSEDRIKEITKDRPTGISPEISAAIDTAIENEMRKMIGSDSTEKQEWTKHAQRESSPDSVFISALSHLVKFNS